MRIEDILRDILPALDGAAAPNAQSPGEMVRMSLAGQMPGIAPRVTTQAPMGAPVGPVQRAPFSAPAASSGAPARLPMGLGAAPSAPAAPAPQSFSPNPLSTLARGYQSGGIFGMLGNLSEEPQKLALAEAEKRRTEQQALAQNNATLTALMKAGVEPEIAAAAVGNPVLMKQLIETTFRPPAEVKPTSDMQNYEQARRDGFTGTFMDYKTQLSRAGAASTNINMKGETKYDEELGKKLAEDFVEGQKTAATAQRDLSNLAVMESALGDPNLYTGTGGQAIQSVKKAAATLFGVDVKGLASGEVMQNLASEIAVANKEKLPGPMSEGDRQFLVEMAPNLSKTPEGNRALIQLAMAHKRWQVARGKAAREFAAQNEGRLTPQFYGVVAELDNEGAAEISQLMNTLKGMAPMGVRSPTAGTPLGPDPLGLRQ